MQRPRPASSLCGVAHADRDFRHHDGGRDGRPALHDSHWRRDSDRRHHPGRRLDSRHHRDHYYPRIGYSISVLPPGYLSIGFRDRHLFFDAGVWYARQGPAYVVVAPSIGVFVPILPPAYTTLRIGATPYYYANGAYYAPTNGGYVAVAPPEGYKEEAAPPPPPTTASVQPAGDLLFVYPRHKKTDAPITDDRMACTRQATERTGYDPDQAGVGVDDPGRGDYLRAVSSCLEGRGYKVR